jgi:hypothetical protein
VLEYYRSEGYYRARRRPGRSHEEPNSLDSSNYNHFTLLHVELGSSPCREGGPMIAANISL